MPRFAVKQHDNLRDATYRRTHLNKILSDYAKENDRVYGREEDQFPVNSVGGLPPIQENTNAVGTWTSTEDHLADPQLAITPSQQLSLSQLNAPNGQRTWLMPHQTGDRENGQAMAKLIGRKRTPAGSFANFDLPIAPHRKG
ncbi:hypothetical protein WJX84_000609 [Apatococcus fuscideae]|uniref:Uncharacterized protein n=1 Tax=Apatococcus fuscideae TaxID=2026836 RepID=A0AAW1SRV4_9CHLO